MRKVYGHGSFVNASKWKVKRKLSCPVIFVPKEEFRYLVS